MRHWVVGVMVLGLVACQREAEPAPTAPIEPVPAPAPAGGTPVSYACESGQTITARYPDQQTAEVTWQGRGYTLRTAASASGARYVGDGMEWWTRSRDGRETATLSEAPTTGGPATELLERCARDLPAAPVTPAPVSLPAGSAPPCTAASLSVGRAGGDAGAGNRVLVLGLTNTGPAACAVMGYPTVRLLDAAGKAIATVRSENTPSNYFRPEDQPALVTLAPRGGAYFDIASSAVPAEYLGESECPEAATVEVGVPGDAATLKLASPMTPCGRRVRVSPFRSVADPQSPPAPAQPATKSETT